MTTVDLTVRAMRREDIGDGLRLCRLGGWDQVARDWQMFLDSDRGGIVASLGDRIVATAAAIQYGKAFGWVGMVLVDPAVQGRGVGAMMLDQILSRVADIPSIRLDATPAGRPLYRRVNFLEECDLRRMEAMRPALAMRMSQPVQPIEARDLADLCEVDQSVFGAPRRRVLEWMLEGAPEYAHVARVGRRVTGFVFGRHGHEFDHLGPLVADDAETAKSLAAACLANGPRRGWVVDTTLGSGEWLHFLAAAGFTGQRPYVRMYRGGAPPFGRPDRQFAILGPEFG